MVRYVTFIRMSSTLCPRSVSVIIRPTPVNTVLADLNIGDSWVSVILALLINLPSNRSIGLFDGSMEITQISVI